MNYDTTSFHHIFFIFWFVLVLETTDQPLSVQLHSFRFPFFFVNCSFVVYLNLRRFFDLVTIFGWCEWKPLNVAFSIPSPSMEIAVARQPFRVFVPFTVHRHCVRIKSCWCTRLIAVKLKPLRVSMNLPLPDTMYSGLKTVSMPEMEKQINKIN